jgi:hypothetical protein
MDFSLTDWEIDISKKKIHQQNPTDLTKFFHQKVMKTEVRRVCKIESYLQIVMFLYRVHVAFGVWYG